MYLVTFLGSLYLMPLSVQDVAWENISHFQNIGRYKSVLPSVLDVGIPSPYIGYMTLSSNSVRSPEWNQCLWWCPFRVLCMKASGFSNMVYYICGITLTVCILKGIKLCYIIGSYWRQHWNYHCLLLENYTAHHITNFQHFVEVVMSTIRSKWVLIIIIPVSHQKH